MQTPEKTQAEGKNRISLTKATGWTMLGFGAAALVVSIVYTSQILAFIGLGLIFWGGILTYIQTEEYVKETLLEATALPLLEALSQILKEQDCKSRATYLPPKYFTDPEVSRAYVPKQKKGKLPIPAQTQKQETQLFLKNPKGMLITPPGAEIAKLFEKTLGTTFTRVDSQYLQQNMPKLFIEDLEIAQNFEMEIESSKIHVKIENSAYRNINKRSEKLSNLYSTLGCPISSAIACALAKATGKPIIIADRQTSEDGADINIEYHMIEEEQTEQ